MRHLLNTLYVLSQDAYLSLKGENVESVFQDGSKRCIPLHTLEEIVCFSYKGASPALMGECAKRGILLSFYSPNGQYLCDTGANAKGNVLLRRTQYRWADDEAKCLEVSRNFILGKLHNSKYLLLHYLRDHPFQIDEKRVAEKTNNLSRYIEEVQRAASIDSVRGVEGKAAAEYFQVFDELVLQNKDTFRFQARNRRPPCDPLNCLLSFSYSLLANDCSAALRSVGLDPFVGFLHTDRPARHSLALDLMEEMRSVFADRFVLTLVNNRIVNETSFERELDGAIRLDENARKRILTEWQLRKKDEITHPFLKEKVPWGLVPYVQSLLLARCLRGDITGYPPFFWK